jgi:hypothetical protein
MQNPFRRYESQPLQLERVRERGERWNEPGAE